MITAIARQHVLTLRRQNTFLAMLAAFMLMTVLAGAIGWSSHHTIVRVYEEAVRELAAQGKPAPANPFASKPPLSLLSNMAIYVPLIGALVAIIVGHVGIVEDRASGIGRLVLSRPVRRSSYFHGKLAGTLIVLAGILTISLLISALSLAIVNQQIPAISDTGRLVLFYGTSLVYMAMFALIGMVAAQVSRGRSLGLIAALGVWMLLTFVVPQFTSGLRPTTSLNPVTEPVSTSQTFFQVTAHGRPFSVSEQYKAASAQILQTTDPEPVARTARRVAPILGLLLLLTGLSAWLMSRQDYAQGGDRA